MKRRNDDIDDISSLLRKNRLKTLSYCGFLTRKVERFSSFVVWLSEPSYCWVDRWTHS